MKSFNLLVIVICSIMFLTSIRSWAQKENLIENSSGYVIFNLGANPNSTPQLPDSVQKRQELSLYGCNTQLSTRHIQWNGKENLEWGADHQVLTDVPYGYHKKGKKGYYVSKYYMASPPVQKLMETPIEPDYPIQNIGLVVPDRFTFFGEKPVQVVNLDYTILQQVYLNYVKVNYDYKKKKEDSSCRDYKVSLIPLNIQCDDFNWLVEDPVIGGKGASGIARLRDTANNRQVFLPSYKVKDEFLNCEITILDDILPEHEVFFATDTGLTKSLSLTQFYNKYKNSQPINLSCTTRTELPVGCRKKQ